MESIDKPKYSDRDLYQKWGRSVVQSGWTSVPNVLLKNASHLKLDPTETLTLIYLIRFWWKAKDHPFPSVTKTSEEMGVTRKTMSKKFASLKEKGFITEVKTRGGVTQYSLEGLVQKLKELAQVDSDWHE